MDDDGSERMRTSAMISAAARRPSKRMNGGSTQLTRENRPAFAPEGALDGAAVEAEGLVKTYRGRSGTVEAVRGVDLRVEAGEIFGFLGPNGAGKSTTVRMLTTLLSLTSGTARVAGLDVAKEPDAVRRSIGVALQEAGLDQRQTGRELLELQGRLFELSARETAKRAVDLLELVE